jgi:hypothetical protein
VEELTVLRRWGWLALLFLAAPPLSAQISPGPLSAPHASLEGSSNCLKCHEAGRGVSASRCLDCHTALKQRIASRKGLHARQGYQKCETCHNEHHGRKFELVFWGKTGQAAFDHRQTGFHLVGAHAAQGCRECHRPAFIKSGPQLQAGQANPSRTFLGLSPGCLSCHRDEHRGQFGTTGCLNCHTMGSWQKRTFDHAKTSFPLTGQHQSVACASCHPSRSDPKIAADPNKQFTVFKGIRHAKCSDCHKDPHQGSFGATCQQCHSTAGWKQGARANFDHSKTGFPLTGEHKKVACASCHKTRDAAGAVTFKKMAQGRCADCHKDPHQGRFGTNCQQCHSTAGFRTGLARSGFDHGKTRFPLRGAHQKVACQSCHGTGQPMRVPKKFDRCADCHSDPHVGQLAAKTCESCHTVASFSPSTFTLQQHQKTRYPLEGSHLAVPCNACHKPVAVAQLPKSVQEKAPRDRPARIIQFRFSSTGCATCHGDPHQGEVNRFVSQGGCETCHSQEGFTHVVFDHDRTRFPLEGGHERVACRSCHADPKGPKGSVRFQGIPTACASCHGDPHEGQFARASPPLQCVQCHSVLGWSRVSFDHARARFKLEGAHRSVACGQCHKTEVREGKRMVRFKPLPLTCEGCHGAKTST